MRFRAEGPDIPDDLLLQRDTGNVVFVCGAGVSANEGLPTLQCLTRRLVGTLRVPEHSEVMSALKPWLQGDGEPIVPIDQVFLTLHRDYDPEQVNRCISDALRTPVDQPVPDTTHRAIARISSNSTGVPRIVTTNFDLLFEHALADYEPKPRVFVPPNLPIVDSRNELVGITYLHGRFQEDMSVASPYVTSSAEFGLAYLADGWATKFMRRLLMRYTVVFLGYKAEDLPVKYLLQGLNLSRFGPDLSLYAFERGNSDAIKAKWNNRGVIGIPYTEHKHLWETIDDWAGRADDPIAWQHKTAKLAEKSPYDCSEVIGEQVRHLARSVSGARAFANADPAPHPEWIFALEGPIRTSSQEQVSRTDSLVPAPEDGLDSISLATRDDDNGHQTSPDDLLQWIPGDDNPTAEHRLSLRQVHGRQAIPRRLVFLIYWITRVLDAPVVAWWAYRQHGLHPVLLQDIAYRLQQSDDMNSNTRRVWNTILEYHGDERKMKWGQDMSSINSRISQEGWTPSVLNAFEAASTPFFEPSVANGAHGPGQLPVVWTDRPFDEHLTFKVSFPTGLDVSCAIPDEALSDVFLILDGHFRRFVRMLNSIDKMLVYELTCYPTRDVSGSVSLREVGHTFHLFLTLFRRMIQQHCKQSKRIAELWPADDHHIFARLWLYALNQSKLFSAGEVFQNIQALPQNIFWNYWLRREMLFLVQDRWQSFSAHQRRAIFRRCLAGPERPGDWKGGDFEQHQTRLAAHYASWLLFQKCDVAPSEQADLTELRNGIPDWQEGEEESLTTLRGVEGGWIGVDDSPNQLLALPLSEVIQKAEAMSGIDWAILSHRKPFVGLVRDHPEFALDVLVHEMNEGQYPMAYWCQLLESWPSHDKLALLPDLLRSLLLLPADKISHIADYVGWWTRDQLADAISVDRDLAWKVVDHFLDSLLPTNVDITQPSSTETHPPEDTDTPYGRTLTHALNSPIGRLTEGVLNAIGAMNPTPDQGIPRQHQQILERLIGPKGNERDGVIPLLTVSFNWLYYIDSKWTTEFVVPCFAADSGVAQSAWSGLAVGSRGLPQELKSVMCNHLAGIIAIANDAEWEDVILEFATRLLVASTDLAPEQSDGLTPARAEECLCYLSAHNRSLAIYSLKDRAESIENGWKTFFIPFVQKVWPKKSIYRSSEETYSWVEALAHSSDAFPDAFAEVRSRLTSVGNDHLLLTSYLRNKDGRSLVTRHPDTVLELLNTIVDIKSEGYFFHLGELLRLIGESNAKLRLDERWQRLFNFIDRS